MSESASLYGTLKDGIITFPATGIMVNFTVSGGWYGANGSGLQRIMLPGAKAYDYTLALDEHRASPTAWSRSAFSSVRTWPR